MTRIEPSFLQFPALPGSAATAWRAAAKTSWGPLSRVLSADDPDNALNLSDLGVVLCCESIDEQEGVECLQRASQMEPTDPVLSAILAACVRGSETGDHQLPNFVDGARGANFWGYLLDMCENYAPFGKILSAICDLVLQRARTTRRGCIERLRWLSSATFRVRPSR